MQAHSKQKTQQSESKNLLGFYGSRLSTFAAISLIILETHCRLTWKPKTKQFNAIGMQNASGEVALRRSVKPFGSKWNSTSGSARRIA